MTDIKQVKKLLLEAFNSAGASPESISREDALDSVLRLYFAKACHMPKPLIFEAVVNSMGILEHDKELSRPLIRAILCRNDQSA